MKTKKVLSLALAAAMAGSILPAAVNAQDAAYTSVPMDPTDFATKGRTYYIAEKNGFFGSSSADPRSISRDAFMQMENLWKNDWNNCEITWAEGQNGWKQDNTLTFNGIDYNVRVSYTDANTESPEITPGTLPGKGPGTEVKSALRTFDIVGDSDKGTPYYKTFDVADGYYKGISFLGGKDLWGGMPYIRYNYTDGTQSEWVQPGINKKVTEAPSEGEVCLAVPGIGWDSKNSVSTDKDTDGTDLKVYLYQINETSVDSTKMLDSFDVLARNGKVTEGTSDDPVQYTDAAGTVSNYAYTALFVGVTLLTDEECATNTKLDLLADILEQLPTADKFVATDENIALLKQLMEIYSDIDPDTVKSEAGQAIYYRAMDYLQYQDDIQDVFVSVPYTSFVNSFRAYYDAQDVNGNANTFSQTGIVADKFKTPAADANYSWKNVWGEEKHNTLVFNGYEYDIAVVDSSDASTLVTFQPGNASANKGKNYYTIDIADGYYNGISFLGGLEYGASAAAVRLNYSDGTNSGFITLKDSEGNDVKNYGQKGVDGEYLTLTGFSGSTGKGNYTENIRYMHQYNMAVDSNKVLTSIDFPSRDAVIGNGELTAELSGSTYNVRWFGIGLKTNGILIKDAKTVCVQVRPDAFANNERTYYNVYSGYGKGIFKDSFLALNNWKTVPDMTAANYSDGVFTVNDIDYTVRVDTVWGENSSYTSVNSDNYYSRIDVSDGYYTAVSFIGGGKGYKDDEIGYIRFNYKGGRTSGWIQYDNTSVGKDGGNAVAVDGATPENGVAVKSGTAYINQITVPCDSAYVLESFDLIASNGDVVNSEAVAVAKQKHGATYLGMTLLTNRRLQSGSQADDSKEPIEIYAAPNGKDSDDGTAQQPFKTLSRAISAAQEKDVNSTYEREVIITLADGEYEVDNTVNISNIRGKVTIKAAEGANPVVKGSKTVKISDMSDYAGIAGAKKIALSDIGMDYTADSILNKNNSLTATYTFGVFSKDSMNPIAEYPNNDGLIEEESINTTAGDDISIENDEFLYYGDDENLAIEGYFAESYRTYKTTDFTINGATLTLNTIKAKKSYGIKRNWRLFNSLGLMDVSGEWYLDKAQKVLYYIPKTGETEIEVSNLVGDMINSNVANLEISGVTFKDTCGNALNIDGAASAVIDGCTFKEIGRSAVIAKNSSNVNIKNSKLANLGYMGIYAEGGDLKTLTESGNVIENNSVEKPGSIVRCYAQGININGVGNVVRNNYVADSKSILIGFGGALNKITNNEVRRAGREAADLGAIYGGRNLTYLGNEISYNHIVNADRTDGALIAGIYLDDGLSGTNVHHNVIENAGRGVFSNGGALNTIDNNVLVNCYQYGVMLGNNPITGFKIDGKSMTKYAADFFAANSAYEEKFGADYLAPLTVAVENFVPTGVTAIGNKFVNCDTDIVNNANAEVSGTETLADTKEGTVKADIDMNRIGRIKDELDSTQAYAALANGKATVYFVSTYTNDRVLAAVKDADGKLLQVTTAENGVAFDVPEGAASIQVYVWNSLSGMTPVTK